MESLLRQCKGEREIAWDQGQQCDRSSQFQDISWWEAILRFIKLDLKSERKSKMKKDYWILDDGYALVPFNNKMSNIRKRKWSGAFCSDHVKFGIQYISLFSQDRLSYYCCNKYSLKSGGFKLQNVFLAHAVCASQLSGTLLLAIPTSGLKLIGLLLITNGRGSK